MAKMVEVACKNCRSKFLAREADRKRGWGKYCSKSCKAKYQTRMTGYAGPRYRDDDWHDYAMTTMEEGWDAHKTWTR